MSEGVLAKIIRMFGLFVSAINYANVFQGHKFMFPGSRNSLFEKRSRRAERRCKQIKIVLFALSCHYFGPSNEISAALPGLEILLLENDI